MRTCSTRDCDHKSGHPNMFFVALAIKDNLNESMTNGPLHSVLHTSILYIRTNKILKQASLVIC